MRSYMVGFRSFRAFLRGRVHGCVLVASCLLWGVWSASGAVFYVSPDGDDAADGQSWATAKQTIQAAVDAAEAGDTVWVADGIYDVGGRAAGDEHTLANRVVVSKPLEIRSVHGPEVTIIEGAQSPPTRCVWMANGAQLAGFTLRGGVAEGGGVNANGAGAWSESGQSVFSNCVFTGSAAMGSGGGVYRGTLYDSLLNENSALHGGGAANSVLHRATVQSNAASSSGGGVHTCQVAGGVVANNTAMDGGGAYMGTLTDSLVEGNEASRDGGGAAQAHLARCVVMGNSASGDGGGVFLGTVSFCTIQENTAGESGGGVYNATVYNSTILRNVAALVGGGVQGGHAYNTLVAGNTAAYGGGSYAGVLDSCTVVGNNASIQGGGVQAGTYRNCIVQNNYRPDGQINNYGQSVTFSYSCTTPMPAGAGNITNAPQFVRPGSGFGVDYLAGNYRLQAGSPCLNAGENQPWMAHAKDRDDHPRIAFGTVDMGAYERVFRSSAERGPMAGGGLLVITNGIGWGPVTNVLLDGVAVAPSSQGADWFAFALPPADRPGPVDVVVQSSDGDEMVLVGAYTYSGFLIQARASRYGSITPSGEVAVEEGATQTFLIEPDPWCYLVEVLKNGESLGVISSYDWTDVMAHGTVTVSFAALLVTNNTPVPVPEFWMARYGLTNDMDEVVGQDLAGMGLNTWQYYVMDANPTSGVGTLRLDTEWNGEYASVRWLASSNRVYSLLQGKDVSSGLTNRVHGPIQPAASGWQVLDLPVAGDEERLFYRLGVGVPE